MAKTVANVLVGVATLGIREPNDARAEWVSDRYHTGGHSVKLHKGGSGNAGSTHLELIPPHDLVAGTGITMTAWEISVNAGGYSYQHICSAITANFSQIEFLFEDPNSNAWAEITAVPNQAYDGSIAGAGPAWVEVLLASTTLVGWGGHTELDTPFFDWSLDTGVDDIDGVMDLISAEDTNACAPEDWILTRVRIQLWEAADERDEWIDLVVLNAVAYEIEPGAATARGLSLSSPFTEIGYTEDGVVVTYTADEADIEVEEETFPIDRVITKETAEVTCNMAEASLYNMNKAIAGSVLSGSILTLGAGVNKKMNIIIEGITPSGHLASIMMPKVTATGAVGMPYKKDEKTVVPLTLQALKPQGQAAVTIVYNAA